MEGKGTTQARTSDAKETDGVPNGRTVRTDSGTTQQEMPDGLTSDTLQVENKSKYL